jgi:actin-like ATPase involved in cell morphogenesis
MFKLKFIYIKIKRNHVEVTDLCSGETVSKQAIQPFSSTRNVVSSFNPASETIQSALEELGLTGRSFLSKMNILIQQQEGLEGGLSDIEKRALRDLAEMAGANKVFILEQAEPLSAKVALAYLKEM